MSRADIELTPEAKLHRQRIHEHLARMHGQRKLIEELEREDQDARPARLVLTGMLSALEGMLSAHQQLIASLNARSEIGSHQSWNDSTSPLFPPLTMLVKRRAK
jgi:hypothetical protein